MLKLYYAAKTRAGRTRWMLEELGVPYEVQRINMAERQHKSPEYLKIHPLGLVPALADEGKVIYESSAIAAYLADKFPEKGLAPLPGSAERGEYYQWLFFATATVEPAVIQYMNHTMRLPESQRDASQADEARKSLMTFAEVINNALWGKNYLVNDQFSTADVLIGGGLLFASMLKVPFDSFSSLPPYMKRLTERPAWKRSMAD